MLLGHGATQSAESAAPVYQHAAALRQRCGFAEVREAFWKQAPRIEEVLAALRAPRVFIVPLLISQGYFSEVVIPQALGFGPRAPGASARVRREEGRTLFYCEPIGTHPGLAGVVLARARGVVEQFPGAGAPRPQEMTLFLAAHGTGKMQDSRLSIERQVERVRALGLYAGVEAVFLEEAPRIGECYRIARTRHLVMVPFFIGDGLHVRLDIPVLLGEPEEVVRQRLRSGQPAWRNPTQRGSKVVWYTASVGSDPLVADLIWERAHGNLA